MTGTTGIIMWLMMAVMVAAMAGGALVWAKRRWRK
jgi:LPXTG-motif cell wall-anchored protein